MMVRTVKIGNKLQGQIETPKVKLGERPEATYWVTAEVIKMSVSGRFLTVSQRHLAGLASYAVKKVGVRYPDGSSYCIDLATAKPSDPSLPRLAYHDINVMLWTVITPSEEVRIENTMGKMRVAGSRKLALV